MREGQLLRPAVPAKKKTEAIDIPKRVIASVYDLWSAAEPGQTGIEEGAKQGRKSRVKLLEDNGLDTHEKNSLLMHFLS